jgi:hypothetical protein
MSEDGSIPLGLAFVSTPMLIAVKMLLQLRQWIGLLLYRCREVGVARLREDAGVVHLSLRSLGRERIAGFTPSFLQPVGYQME